MSSSPGCSCSECFGLAEFMLQHAGRDFGLPRALGHSYVKPADECSGELTCICPRCQTERSQRVNEGVREARQPWEARSRTAA